MPTKNEIIFLYSGGPANNNPALSLGGSASAVVVKDGLNNLFSDLTQEQSLGGYTDYRCFYVKNASSSDWADVKIYLESETSGGASGLVGVQASNEVQQFNVVSDEGVTGGSFKVSFGDISDIEVQQNSDMDVWAQNFTAAMLAHTPIGGLRITPKRYDKQSNPYNKTFEVFKIEFNGVDGYTNQPLIQPQENSLTPNAALNCSKIVSGAPANTVAIEIPSPSHAPLGVIFRPTSRNAPIPIGNIKVGAMVPIWIRRDILPGTKQLMDDKFVLGFLGTCELF